MASLSVTQRVFHCQKMVLAFRHLLQVKESASTKVGHGKSCESEGFLRMEVSTTCTCRDVSS